MDNGILPLLPGKTDETTFLNTVIAYLASEAMAVTRFRKLAMSSEVALSRVVLQHTDVFLLLLLQAYTAHKHEKLPALLKDLETVNLHWKTSKPDLQRKKSNLIRHEFWKTIFRYHISGGIADHDTDGQKLIRHILGTLNIYPINFLAKEVAKNPQRYPFLKKIDAQILAGWVEMDNSKAENSSPSLLSKKNNTPFTKEETGHTEPMLDIIQGTNKSGAESAINDVSKTSNPLFNPEQRFDEKKIEENKDETKFNSTNRDLRKAESKKVESTLPLPGENIANTKPSDPVRAEHLSPEKISKNIRTGEAFYMRNAGVVLLNPFLSNFFKKLGIIENNLFVDAENQQKAIHLIQYLACGKNEIPEHEMLLAKLLCDMPFEHPVDRFVKLTVEETEEAENLLKAAITHWGALGNASPDALREGFLKRDGKLEKCDNGWRLYVEQQTIDILLRRLPFGWGLGTIKLPWMNEILFVEWG
jgi:hypothetical protein